MSLEPCVATTHWMGMCLPVPLCIYFSKPACKYVYLNESMRVFVSVFMYLIVCVCLCVCVSVCGRIFAYINVLECMHLCVHTHAYMHVNIESA